MLRGLQSQRADSGGERSFCRGGFVLRRLFRRSRGIDLWWMKSGDGRSILWGRSFGRLWVRGGSRLSLAWGRWIECGRDDRLGEFV